MDSPDPMASSSSDQSPGRFSSNSHTRLPHSACIWPGVIKDRPPSSGKGNGNLVEVKETFTSRRFTALQNAASRAKVSNLEELGMGGDDSILGETYALDSTDGVDLRAQRLEMSFHLRDAASLIFSIFSFGMDLILDIVVAIFHYLNDDYWYCGLTVAFIVIPSLVTTGISLRWYILDAKSENSEPVTKMRWTTILVFHIFQIGPILRYWESLQYGMRYRRTENTEEKKTAYLKMIYEDADATMLRLFESFMESAPQLMLQMYIISKNYPFNDYEYWTAIVQVISITSSVVSISWSLVSYSKSLRISLPNKIPMTYSSMAVMFLWELFNLSARMLALALFTSAFVQYIAFVGLAHWAMMTLWIISMDTNFCNTKCEELGFNAVLGVIFLFCYFNPVDNATRYRYLAYYTVIFFENSFLLFSWAKETTYEPWFKLLVFYAHYICFFSGIILMLIYYRWFHPTGGIRIFRSQCN